MTLFPQKDNNISLVKSYRNRKANFNSHSVRKSKTAKRESQTLALHIFLFENSQNISTLQTTQMSHTVFPLLSSNFKHATATNES